MSSPNHVLAGASISGGMDKETSLAWIICGNRLFIWNFLLPAASRNCIIIDLTSATSEIGDVRSSSLQTNNWLVCCVNWDSSKKMGSNVVQQSNSAGIILCNKKNGALIFWPDIHYAKISPLTCLAFLSQKRFICDKMEKPSQASSGKEASSGKVTTLPTMLQNVLSTL